MILSAAEEDVVELEIKVEGMVCGNCSARVAEALKKVDKVKSVDVSLETKMASIVVLAPSQLDALTVLTKLVGTVKDLGFEAEPHIEC